MSNTVPLFRAYTVASSCPTCNNIRLLGGKKKIAHSIHESDFKSKHHHNRNPYQHYHSIIIITSPVETRVSRPGVDGPLAKDTR